MSCRSCSLPGCLQPCYQEPGGRVHDYCGRSHATQAGALAPARGASGGPLCQLSGCNKPCYVDQSSGRVFSYCGLTHAKQGGEEEEELEELARLLGFLLIVDAIRDPEPVQVSPTVASASSGPSAWGPPRCALGGCNRLCAQNPSGGFFDYCGRSHADKARAEVQTPSPTHHFNQPSPFTPPPRATNSGVQCPPPPVPPGLQCARLDCYKRKANRTDGTSGYHDFCSIACRNAYRQCSRLSCSQQRAPNNHGGLHEFCSRECRDTAKAEGPICPVPDCGRPVFKDGVRTHDFCSKTHSRLRDQHHITIFPSTPPSGSGWMRPLATSGEDGVLRASVVDQFLVKWAKGTKPTVIKHVFVINSPPSVYSDFVRYVDEVEAEGPFDGQKRGDRKMVKGNVCRLFHGTSSANGCLFGRQPDAKMCGNQCAICSIASDTFDPGKAARATGYMRFGYGCYFSHCSSKSNDYNGGSEVTIGADRIRAMFLCKVVVGRCHKITVSKWNDGWRQPPQSPTKFHSVQGEVGADLNYPETVVYRKEAAIPLYIIAYVAP